MRHQIAIWLILFGISWRVFVELGQVIATDPNKFVESLAVSSRDRNTAAARIASLLAAALFVWLSVELISSK